MRTAALLSLCLTGCGSGATDGLRDAATPDAGLELDGAAPDAPSSDAPTRDAGAVDASASELGVDAGIADAAAVPRQSGLEVRIDTGRVRGRGQGSLRVFKGIPYADPPTGALRFRPPQPSAPWPRVWAADDYGPACPQPRFGPEFLLGGFAGPQSEDCLSLNVWGHLDDAPLRPVMVFVYGGGFVVGASAWPLYDGARLARRGDVVVVTLNYRVGVLGYLATEELAREGSTGNMGLLDQIEALRWVQRNIRAFGGDPENVTVFGESAGAISVCALLGTPSADSLFHKAIIQSGLCQLGTARGPGLFGAKSALEAGADVVRSLGCDNAADPNRCLRALPVERLVDAVPRSSILTGDLDAVAATSPHVDGRLVPEQPLARIASGTVDKPLLVGSNEREGLLFAGVDTVLSRRGLEDAVADFFGSEALARQILELYPRRRFPVASEAWIALLGEATFICHGLAAALASASGQPAFAYHFTRSPLALRAVGATHAVELPYVFGTFDALRIPASRRDRRLGDEMQDAWTRFARTGRPAAPDAWPAYAVDDPAVRILDVPSRVEDEIREGRCAGLRALGVVP